MVKKTLDWKGSQDDVHGKRSVPDYVRTIYDKPTTDRAFIPLEPGQARGVPRAGRLPGFLDKVNVIGGDQVRDSPAVQVVFRHALFSEALVAVRLTVRHSGL